MIGGGIQRISWTTNGLSRDFPRFPSIRNASSLLEVFRENQRTQTGGMKSTRKPVKESMQGEKNLSTEPGKGCHHQLGKPPFLLIIPCKHQWIMHRTQSNRKQMAQVRSQGFEAQAVGAALKKVQKASPCLAPRVWAKHRWYRCAWPGNDARKIAIIALS